VCAREGVEVRLRPVDRERLEGVVSYRKSPQYHVCRARILLMTADGSGTMAIHAATGRGKPTICRWQAHYMHNGADGLFRDAPRGRAYAAASSEQIAAVVERTLHEDPPGAPHWTLRSMAKASGLAPSTVHRIWREHGLKPHRIETFKLSNDPKFVEKNRDIVGLYVMAIAC
jgi:transposase